jgi:hypothetical protein
VTGRSAMRVDPENQRRRAGFLALVLLALVLVVGIFYSHEALASGVPFTGERHAPGDIVHDTAGPLIPVPNVTDDIKQMVTGQHSAQLSLASEHGHLRELDELGFGDIEASSDKIIGRNKLIRGRHWQSHGASKDHEMRVFDHRGHSTNILDVATPGRPRRGSIRWRW